MKPLNKIENIEEYRHFGPLTQPFLDKDYVYNKVLNDLKNKQKDESSIHFLTSLILWIHKEVKYSKDDDIQNLKFRRTANDIWKSKKASGCTDFGLLFATFARQLSIPTTILHTAEYDWLRKLKSGQNSLMHIGHTFCECYFGDNWILVDPTSKYIKTNYNPEKLELPYSLGGKSVFIPYFRGLDLGEKQTVRIHNQIMDDLCNKLEI
mgnify:CR=1 FL=1